MAIVRRDGLRVVIDARLRDGEPGGVQQVVIGLAHGLSRLTDGSGDEYLFATWKHAAAWLGPFIGGSCRIVELPTSRLRAVGRRARQLVAATGLLGTLPSPAMRVVTSDSAVEALRGRVIHFQLQRAFLTRTPTMYQPHDLQHRHFPEFFSPEARVGRDRAYQAYCAQATAVVVMSEWGRDDIVRQFQLPPEKVCVVPGAPLLPEYPAVSDDAAESVRRKYSLPPRFAYFPAQTFPHKNHLGLFEALAWLRNSTGLEIPVVCSGRRNEFHQVLRKRARDLLLDRQVHFLGFVPATEVRALYKLCSAVVLPSLFEGWALPLGEAFVAGVPVACSRVTCLPRQSDGAAVLFDPRDPIAIGRALERVWTDDALRARLVDRGRQVVGRLSWDRTAEMFRAHYRRIAGRRLSAHEQELIQGAPVC